MIEESDFCEFCDGITKPGLVTHTFERNGQKFTFADIKAQVCQKCGEVYIDGAAMPQIERKITEKVFASV
jgi:YgiT-type zinc finger domain-containing protein